MHLLIQKARLHMKESHLSRFRYAALAIWLSLLSGAGILNAQSSPGTEHAARSAQLLEAGDLKGAEAEMRRAVELAPRDPQYLVRLGLILGNAAPAGRGRRVSSKVPWRLTRTIRRFAAIWRPPSGKWAALPPRRKTLNSSSKLIPETRSRSSCCARFLSTPGVMPQRLR